MLEEKKYKVILTEEQLRVIAECLDSESRMLCGQIDSNKIYAFKQLSLKRNLDEMQDVDEKLKEVKKILFPDLHKHANYGIGHDKLSDLMYDMYKSIKKEIKRIKDIDDIEKGIPVTHNVDDRGPLGLTDHPLIEVKFLSQDVIRDDNIDDIMNN